MAAFDAKAEPRTHRSPARAQSRKHRGIGERRCRAQALRFPRAAPVRAWRHTRL